MPIRRLALVLVLGVAGVAGAQPRPAPTADAKKQADEAFERGRSAYSFGNFDLAIREYQAAFALTGAPELAFNIAQTYRAKGDKQHALEFYKKYIELDPAGAGVVSAREHIDSLENQIRAEADAERLRLEQAEAAKRAAAETARRAAADAAQRRVADAEAARKQSIARTLRLAGLAATGAGVATIGVSGYFGMRARSLSRDASDTQGMWTEEAQRIVDRANSAQTTMYLLLGVGGAVAATGGVLYFVGTRTRESLTVTPAPTRGGAGVWLGGRF